MRQLLSGMALAAALVASAPAADAQHWTGVRLEYRVCSVYRECQWVPARDEHGHEITMPNEYACWHHPEIERRHLLREDVRCIHVPVKVRNRG